MSDTPRNSPPMYFPDGFDLQAATICNILVDAAYDQFAQWIEAGQPEPPDFQWKPKVTGFTYSAPIWWIYGFFFEFIEPFGFVAQAPNGDTFITL